MEELGRALDAASFFHKDPRRSILATREITDTLVATLQAARVHGPSTSQDGVLGQQQIPASRAH